MDSAYKSKTARGMLVEWSDALHFLLLLIFHTGPVF